MVYDKSTFENARFDIVVDKSELGSDVDPATAVKLEHTIEEVNGTANVEDEISVNGRTLGDDSVSGVTSATDVLAFLSENAGENDPNTAAIGSESLDASLAAQQGGLAVTVETFDNFSTGTYQWGAVSSLGDSQGSISTKTGTLQLKSSSGGGGYNPPSGGGSDPGDDDGSKDKDPKVTASVTADIVDVDPDTPGVTVRLNNSSVEEITFSNEDTTGEVTVNDTETLPDETGSPTGQMVRSFEITVPEEACDKSATFRVKVDKSKVDDLGADESDLIVNRYNESAGEWQELSTDVAECECGDIVLEAETPGFSWFAVTAPEDQSPTDTPADPTPTQTPAGDDDGATATETEDDDGDDDELLPGFTAGVALIAILGAALLAARRQQ